MDQVSVATDRLKNLLPSCFELFEMAAIRNLNKIEKLFLLCLTSAKMSCFSKVLMATISILFILNNMSK